MTYTPAEWQAILDALPASAGSVDEAGLRQLLGTIAGDLINTVHEVPAQQDRVRRAGEALAACETLLESIAARRADARRGDSDDPADILDPMGSQVAAARDGYRAALEMEQRVLSYLESKSGEPADMVVMKAAARVWQHYGGRVDYRSAFDRFFQAVTGPKFRTPEASRLNIGAYVATRKQRVVRDFMPRKKKVISSKPMRRR